MGRACYAKGTSLHWLNAQASRKENNVKICQHDAWMKAISLGYGGASTKCADARNMRMRINHFHPSVIDFSSGGKTRLKVGAAPTVCLTKFSMEKREFQREQEFVKDCRCKRGLTRRA